MVVLNREGLDRLVRLLSELLRSTHDNTLKRHAHGLLRALRRAREPDKPI